MRLGHLFETILTVLMMIFILMVMLGVLLIVEVVNFIVGQPVSLPLKVSTFIYLGLIFVAVSYLAARRIYNVFRYG